MSHLAECVNLWLIYRAQGPAFIKAQGKVEKSVNEQKVLCMDHCYHVACGIAELISDVCI